MSHTSHDALRQYLGITGVSPVGSIRDCRIPYTLPSCGSRREPSGRAVFFGENIELEQAAGSHRYGFGVADHQMVQHTHAYQA